MKLFSINKKKMDKRKEGGFTLVELMVSVGIFALVLLMALSSIITIIDTNRKARTLTEVMSNVNFAFESMTRTIKTGQDFRATVADTTGCNSAGDSVGDSIEVSAIDPTSETDDFDRVDIIYRLCESDGVGVIERKIGTGSYIAITAPEVDIDILDFKVFAHNDSGTPSEFSGGGEYPDGSQPRVLIVVGGTVDMVRGAGSRFNLQTSVSQLDLNVAPPTP